MRDSKLLGCRSIPTLPALVALLAASLASQPAWAQVAAGGIPQAAPVAQGAVQQPGFAAQGIAPAQPGVPVAQPQAAAGDPAYRLAEANLPRIQSLEQAAEGEHPLAPAIRWAHRGKAFVDQHVVDYSCTMVKRERIDGELGEHQFMFCKVRNNPFSVYTYFLGPAEVKGREAIFVEGSNEGKLLAHGTGATKLMGTVSLKPDGMIAMTGNRYPITQMGLRRLLERLIEVGNEDMKYGECEVRVVNGAKINNRLCTLIQVVHPVPRQNFLYHIARIYVDEELQLPVRFEAYEWPTEPGGPPLLTEEYTYLNLKLNQGFTDADFDVNNPAYGYR
jgi:hypothetical protein